MALNLNKVMLAGNISTDIELKQTNSGLHTVTFNIAVNTYQKNGGNQADFFTVVVWEKKADFVSQYFHKGMPIFVEGILKNENWTDKQGNKRVSTKIVASDVRFVVGKNDAESGGASSGDSFVPSAFTGGNNEGFEEVPDGQLPF